MATFNFELVSPERVLFSGPVEQVVLPGEEGDMAILADHAPVMTTLRPGIILVSESKGSAKRLFVRGGFADVTAAGLTILAEHAVPTDEVSAEKMAADIKSAEEDLRDAKAEDERLRAQQKLDGLRAMQTVLRG